MEDLSINDYVFVSKYSDEDPLDVKKFV